VRSCGLMADTMKCGNCGQAVDGHAGLFMFAGWGSADDDDPVGAWCDWACMAADVTSKYAPRTEQE
jgi:hypothetical protein